MRTVLKISVICLPLVSQLLFSCAQADTLDAEMQQWCECEQAAANNVSQKHRCDQIKKDITRKYEFDPQAAVKIQTKVLECNR